MLAFTVHNQTFPTFPCRVKEDKSPKPKKKFGSNFGSNVSNFGSTLKKSAIGSIRRPNMANFKQKIKNKLKKGQGEILYRVFGCVVLNGSVIKILRIES